MPGHDLIPEPASMFEHLNATLDEIPGRLGKIDRQLVTHSEAIEAKCRQFKRRYDDEDNWTLNISPNWQFKIEDGRDFASSEGMAVVGGRVQVRDGEYEIYSFNLSILQKGYGAPGGTAMTGVNQSLCCSYDFNETWTMVRRFHFDVDVGGPGEEPKPVCHLQTGGKMANADDIVHRLHYCRTELDKPRIPHPPMDLVLILDLILEQYGNLASYRDKNWHGLVLRSEEELWGPYFDHLGSRYRAGGPSRVAVDIISNG